MVKIQNNSKDDGNIVTFMDGLLAAYTYFSNGSDTFSREYNDGTKGIYINDKTDISPTAMRHMGPILAKYGERPYPTAGFDRQDDCLSPLTLSEYLELEILGNGQYQKMEGKEMTPLSEVEDHLKKCDRCFNVMVNTYGELIDMASEDPEIAKNWVALDNKL